MKLSLVAPAALAAVALLGSTSFATVLTQWTFATTSAAPTNSPAPDFGGGVATPLGMTNSYTFSSGNTITGTGTFTPGTVLATGSTTNCDVLGTAGDPNGFANAWRVRGPATNGGGSTTGNGWALQAPQFTQGAQFSDGTVSFTNIAFHADWFSTTQGVKNLQPQFTVDGTNWISIGSLLTSVSNSWEQIDLTLPSTVDNDPNFGVRLVSAYDPTLSPTNYGSSDGSQAGVYNNSSGNWRFANVVISGTPAAVPEPASLAVLALGASALISRRRKA